MITRRHYLARIGAAALAASARPCLSADADPQVMTVRGPISAANLRRMLPHEHILVDFIGADRVSQDRYQRDEVFNALLPHLKRIRELGCDTFVDCTPAYLGRDPQLLQRLSQASGLHILTNTGYYGARSNKYLPPHALSDSSDALATRWIAEFKNGIENTGIRPGFMKIGVDAGPLSDVHRKLIVAAARAHLITGLTIATHTGNGQAAMDQLKTLKGEGVDPSAWIWVHANSERDRNLHLDAARQGAWVEFDGVSASSLRQHLALVQHMKENGLLNRVLISHDAGWYHVGEPAGGKIRPFDLLFDKFVPALKNGGLNESEIDQLLAANPQQAFVIRVRRIKN